MLNQCFISVTFGLNSQVIENAHLSEQDGVLLMVQTCIGNVLDSNLGWDTSCTELCRFLQPRTAAVGTPRRP